MGRSRLRLQGEIAYKGAYRAFFRTIVFCDRQRHETSIAGDASFYLIEFEQLLS